MMELLAQVASPDFLGTVGTAGTALGGVFIVRELMGIRERLAHIEGRLEEKTEEAN